MARPRKPLRDLSVDLDEDVEYLKFLLYGESGVGKTVWGGSDDDVLFISPDRKGPVSAKRMGSTAKRWPVSTWDDLDKCAEYWYDFAVVKGNPIPYKWFCIDTLTEVQDLGMDSILVAAVAANPARDKYIPALQDYLKNQAMVRALVKGFNELPVNVLYTAWTVQYTDTEGQETLLPDIRGGAKKGYTFSKEICGLMTSFGYMKLRLVKEGTAKEKTESRRIIWKQTRTAADGLITAKDRTRVLAPHTDDMTLKQVRELVEAGPPPPPTETAPRRTARKTTGSSTTTRRTRRAGTTRTKEN